MIKEFCLNELLTNLTENQNAMAKKILYLSHAVIELQDLMKQKLKEDEVRDD